MNAVYLERANLTAGPLDGHEIPVTIDQQVFVYLSNGQEHTYLRVGNTRNFFHVSIKPFSDPSEELETVGLSVFQDEPPSSLKSILSIAWIHKLRSKMG